MSLPEQDTVLLEQALARGAVILVPNYRGSDQLIDSICALRTRQGAPKVQPRPAVFAIDLWLNDLWASLALNSNHPVLGWRQLSSAEENLTWRQLIRKSPNDLVLLQEEGTAIALGKALLLLQQWQIPLSDVQKLVRHGAIDLHADDQQLALHWFNEFTRYCNAHELLGFSTLVKSLIEILDADSTLAHLLPEEILLWEFDQPPPLYHALFECLVGKGCNLQTCSATPGSAVLSLQQFVHTSEECQAAALWASEIHQAQPQARIAIICPDSALLKHTLPRALHHQLGPDSTLAGNSAVTNLTELSWFATAQTALGLFNTELPTLELCALIRSPWLAGALEEQDARAALEREIRSRQELFTLISYVKALCAQDQKPWHCPALLTMFELGVATRPGFHQRQSISEWQAVIQGIWSVWLPRTILLASGNRQLVQAVDSISIALQKAGTMAEQLDWQAALSHLRALVRATTLQETKRQAPVMLLSPTAAAGLHFTHIWNMGMTDQFWPATETPNPFLPLVLQREHSMPGTDPDRTLANARRQLQQIISHTSSAMVLSYASQSGNEAMRASPLLPASMQSFSQGNTPYAGLPSATRLQEPLQLESIQDSRLLANSKVQGSSRYIELQAICPFRAFAEQGLGITALDEPAYGLSRAAIGTLIHDALRTLWTELGNLAVLKNTPPAEQQILVKQSVQQALGKVRHKYPASFTPALQQLEQHRLEHLLHQWLLQELGRDDFEIYHTELPARWHNGKLTLDLRIDRIDREKGKLIVIDYKSGSIPANTWDTTAPPQFQLLLYMFALEQQLASLGEHTEVAGLLFASLDPANLHYIGITDLDNAATSLNLSLANSRLKVSESDWSSLKVRWKTELDALATEILNGYAAVQPRQKSASCQYCALPAMCRKTELGLG